LKTVVFPAPFGPINATSSRGRTSSEKSQTAVRPPKRMVAWRTSINASLASRLPGARGGRRLRHQSQTSRVPKRPRGRSNIRAISAME